MCKSPPLWVTCLIIRRLQEAPNKSHPKRPHNKAIKRHQQQCPLQAGAPLGLHLANRHKCYWVHVSMPVIFSRTFLGQWSHATETNYVYTLPRQLDEERVDGRGTSRKGVNKFGHPTLHRNFGSLALNVFGAGLPHGTRKQCWQRAENASSF